MNRYNVDGPQINWIHFKNAYDNSEKKREINWENLKYIDNWLNDKGYTLPQRQAIIYNIYQESGGNPAAVSKDGRFAGLLQWDTEKGGRYSKIKDKSLDGQLQYIDDTLYGSLAFNGQNWMGMTRDATRANQAKFTNAKTARDAMDILTRGYVRPNKEVSENRMNSFQVYFPIESENKVMPFLEAPRGEYQYTPYNTPSFKDPYIPTQSIDLNTKEGFDNPILQYRVNKNMNEYNNGGAIHIKSENKGKFTAAAKRAGKSVQGYASQILAHPENYSPTLRKRAQFAHNAAKWNACGGKLYPDGGPIDPPALSAWNYVDNNRQNRQRMKLGYMLPENAFAYQQDVNAMTERANLDYDDYRTAVAIMGDPTASNEEKAYAQHTMDMAQERANQMVRAANTGMNKLPQWYLQLGLNELDSGYSPKDRREAMKRIRNSGLPKIAKKDLQRMYSSERNVLFDVVNSPEYAAAENIPGVGDALSGISGLVNLASGNTGLGLLDLAAAAPFIAAPGVHKIAKGEVPLRPRKKVAKKVKNAVDGHRPNLSYLEETSGIVFPDKQTHQLFDNFKNRIKREPRKSRYNLSDIDMSYMTDKQKEAVKHLIPGRKRGKKWVNTHKKNPFKGKSVEEQVEMLCKELENMASNVTSTSNETPTLEAKQKKQRSKFRKAVVGTVVPIGLTAGGIGLWSLNEKKKDNNNEYTKYKTDKEAVNDQTSYQDSVMRDYYDNFTGDSIYQPNVDSYNQYRDMVPDSLRSKLENIILNDSLEKIQMAEDVNWKWYGEKTPKKR